MKKVVFVLGLRTLTWPNESSTSWYDKMWFAVIKVDNNAVMLTIMSGRTVTPDCAFVIGVSKRSNLRQIWLLHSG